MLISYISIEKVQNFTLITESLVKLVVANLNKFRYFQVSETNCEWL